MRKIDILAAIAQAEIDKKEREEQQTFRDKHLWKFTLFGGLFGVAIMTIMMALGTYKQKRERREYQEIFNSQSEKWTKIHKNTWLFDWNILVTKDMLEQCKGGINKTSICKYIDVNTN